ncbi:MAG: ribosomal protein S18-alanine N-acetyltransferase [Oscillospiraceae bacterium]|nr:ribosomal protein S18-alanine N-acetyltransferase [Oscillospiraceae bacterium]
MNVLFLCTGNTCRSPLAAALFCAPFSVQSAGICAAVGSPASTHSIAIAAELGCDISTHAAQQLTYELLHWADAIVCLARNHALAVADHVPHSKLHLLGGGIADPFGGTLEDYRACAAQMQAAMPALLRNLQCMAQIVPTQATHLPALAQLELVAESVLREKLALETCHMLTALIDGEIAGNIYVDEIAGVADINNLAVFAGYQRQGIANRLLAQAELGAALRGCTHVHLDVRESNAAARALYASRGYQEVGSRPSYYSKPTEDAILMTLEIQ